MTDHFDALESRDPAAREADFFARFASFLRQAMGEAPGLKRHLGSIDPLAITSRAALAGLPVLRKTVQGGLAGLTGKTTTTRKRSAGKKRSSQEGPEADNNERRSELTLGSLGIPASE